MREAAAGRLAVKHFISLGAGVQSSRMALGAARGEIKPMPLGAIFADTGWEPPEVYAFLEFLEAELPFPVYRTKTDSQRHGGMSLREFTLRSTLRDKKIPMPLPLFVRDAGKLGMTRRQCTRDFKIRPIDKLTKRLAGFKPGAKLPRKPVVTKWIGISLDEIVRAKHSREPWQVHRFPLAFELQERREDCLAWMDKHGYPTPPRSACIGCPYHDALEWWKIKQDPVTWADAVDCDERIRNAGGMRGEAFLHYSGRPLAEAVPDERPPTKAPDPVNMQLFAECDGMCGV